MSRNERGVREKVREKLKKPEVSPVEALEVDRARRAQSKNLREARAAIKELEREVEAWRERAGLLAEVDGRPDPKPITIRRRGKKGAKPQATYFALASDWHVGERVRPETVGWRNEYFPEIAAERAAQFFESNLTMLNAARSAWEIKEGVLWLGGDLITGYIHEEYQSENYLSPTEESLLAFDLLNRGIRFLLDRSDLEKIRVPTNHGNHGRTTTRYRVSAHYRNSYEFMLYELLARRWSGEPRLEFSIARGYHNVVDAYGVGVRFHHGEQIGYQGGIGGLAIPANRRIGRQAAGEKKLPADLAGPPILLDCIGHYHQLQYPQSLIVNGSLIGWNDFADSKGFGYEPPQQASFVIDEKYRIVSAFSPIVVAKAKK